MGSANSYLDEKLDVKIKEYLEHHGEASGGQTRYMDSSSLEKTRDTSLSESKGNMKKRLVNLSLERSRQSPSKDEESLFKMITGDENLLESLNQSRVFNRKGSAGAGGAGSKPLSRVSSKSSTTFVKQQVENEISARSSHRSGKSVYSVPRTSYSSPQKNASMSNRKQSVPSERGSQTVERRNSNIRSSASSKQKISPLQSQRSNAKSSKEESVPRIPSSRKRLSIDQGEPEEPEHPKSSRRPSIEREEITLRDVGGSSRRSSIILKEEIVLREVKPRSDVSIPNSQSKLSSHAYIEATENEPYSHSMNTSMMNPRNSDTSAANGVDYRRSSVPQQHPSNLSFSAEEAKKPEPEELMSFKQRWQNEGLNEETFKSSSGSYNTAKFENHSPPLQVCASKLQKATEELTIKTFLVRILSCIWSITYQNRVLEIFLSLISISRMQPKRYFVSLLDSMCLSQSKLYTKK